VKGWQKLIATAGDLGSPIAQGAKILDFGCGNGDTVHALRMNGFDAHGCDFHFKPGENVERLNREGLLATIEPVPYRLPYKDSTFDFILSQQVFEHVQNYGETFSEIHRVLKVGAMGLHVFPSRYRPIESHVFVPFASIIQNYWWLRLWAQLGVRNPSQVGMDARQVAKLNYDYLTNNTNYLSERRISKLLDLCFDEHGFCEKQAARYTRLVNQKWILGLPFLSILLKNYTRVMYMRRGN